MMSIAMLAAFAAAALYRVQPRLATTYHSSSWSEAFNAAEAGADLALKAMNDSVMSPDTAWAAWTPNDATTFPKTWVPTIAPHGGDGNTKVYCRVTADNSIVDRNGAKWIRVRSLGVAELPGTSRTGIEAAVCAVDGTKTFRSILRKERFIADQTGGVLHLPQIVRTVEALAAPPSARRYSRALLAQDSIKMSGSALIDSFDSSDATKSTNSLYDAAKRQSNGDIASNSSGELSDLNDKYVYGDASSNGGVIHDTANVQGNVYNNFTTDIAPVGKPVWSTFNVNPVAIKDPSSTVTLQGGPVGSPQNFKLTELKISHDSRRLILAPHETGAESYINIWVTGKMSVLGNGYIEQQPGVHVQIFCEDDITIGGGGFVNQSNIAANLQVFGINPESGTPKVHLSGGAGFTGVLNAPEFPLEISGNGTFVGAVIAKSVKFGGNGGFHYDEALANFSANGGTKYQYASWIEDIR